MSDDATSAGKPADEKDNSVSAASPPAPPREEQPDLSEFDAYVKKWAIDRRPEPSPPLFNKTPGHAAIVLRWLFKSGENTAKILTGGMNADIYARDEVATAITNFLSKPHAHMTIIFDEQSVKGNVAVDEPYIRKHLLLGRFVRADNYKNKIEFWVVPKEIRDTYTCHFVVIDGRSFRFEQDRTKHEATGQFDNFELAETLSGIFKRLLTKCVRLGVSS